MRQPVWIFKVTPSHLCCVFYIRASPHTDEGGSCAAAVIPKRFPCVSDFLFSKKPLVQHTSRNLCLPPLVPRLTSTNRLTLKAGAHGLFNSYSAWKSALKTLNNFFGQTLMNYVTISTIQKCLGTSGNYQETGEYRHSGGTGERRVLESVFNEMQPEGDGGTWTHLILWRRMVTGPSDEVIETVKVWPLYLNLSLLAGKILNHVFSGCLPPNNCVTDY